MIFPCFMFVCDVCEAKTALVAAEPRIPSGWDSDDEFTFCPECVAEAAEDHLSKVPAGVVLSLAQSCP